MNGVPSFRTSDLRATCADQCYISCHLDDLPDWGQLFEGFRRGIKPADVDGMVEINGHFLFLEQKGSGVPLESLGQQRALKALQDLDRVSVLVFRQGAVADFEVKFMRDGREGQWLPMSLAEFRNRIEQWADWAEAQTST
jgi:hypothetical protein